MKQRNHIARANRLLNKPKVVKAKKGKGSYNRQQINREVSKRDPLFFLLWSVVVCWCMMVESSV